ncbi:LuxR C-terminal-related transcriptional regulator [Pseudomonas chlororaphis]|uniref:helix-turn-helix transcriptional regulator n=1 Tax=Pseudomonas chlororaphis TaxID=587753 RepID=UPI00209BB7DE|nr:LuxR C-terminal-related transcriptional regulator [Pseudomonas chlororaphis]MCO7613364.1 LuxR C-terminal-related transcriptional regulator [Pseudomonas chlororaphis]
MTASTSLPGVHELGQRCIAAFTRVVPATLCAFYRIDRQLQARDFSLYGMPEPMHQAYLQRYRHYDPLQPRHCAAAGRPVLSLHMGMAHQGRHATEVYQGFLQRHGVLDVVEILARDGERPIAGLSLLRDNALGHFSVDELGTLHALQGLLEIAALAPYSQVDQRLANLTPREREIAWLLRDGADNKTIARRLDLGLPTVKTHLINLFRKVGVGNRTELVSSLFL